MRRYQLLVISLSAFKEAATIALTRNMMKRGWKVSFLVILEEISTKRKEGIYWYKAMPLWACRPNSS
jgi:hypothetical protein